jgi:hypothetical protein
MGGAVWLMFISGILLGGHLYNLADTSEGMLSSIFSFCDLGAGLLYFACRAAAIATVERPELATAEYGNVMLMVAGLLNYLLMLDAFDIRIGRKS